MQQLAGEVELEFEAIDAGDLDLSGRLDERDVELMRQALDVGAALPTALLDEFAYPGGVVALVSPALLEPDTDIAVFVDNEPSAQVMRAVLGYVTFEVPPAIVGKDADVEVTLQVDGFIAAHLALHLRATPERPAGVSAKEDVLAFFGELGALIEQQRADEARLIEEVGGLSAEETAVLLGGAAFATQELAAAAAALEALLDTEGGEELAMHLQSALYANGIAEFRSAATAERGIAASASALSADICERYVPVLCALQGRNEQFEWGVYGVMALCTTLEAGSILTLNPLALIAVAKYCTPLIVALELVGFASKMVDPVTLDINLTSDKAALMEPAEVATIGTEVLFGGLHEICALSRQFRGYDTELIVKYIVKALLKTNLKLRAIKAALEGLNKGKILEEALRRILQQGLGGFGLEGVLTNIASRICHHVGYMRDRELAAVSSHGRYFNLQASNSAPLQLDADGTYRLACPANFNGTVVVSGEKTLCNETKRADVAVSCRAVASCDGPTVEIPDLGLREVLEEALGKRPGEPITPSEMLNITGLSDGRSVRNLQGLECAKNMTGISDLGGGQLTDISPLVGLTKLEWLDLYNNQITDLSPLAGLTKLEWLDLYNNKITDISPLAGLTKLWSLNLGDNQITDLSPLAGLTNLGGLNLWDNQITDLSPLAGLTNLDGLNLGDNQITDISPLAGLTKLWSLSLYENQITDLSPLAGLTNLGGLNLWDNQITDISPLAGLTNLETLWLHNNPICKSGMPDWAISRWGQCYSSSFGVQNGEELSRDQSH